LFKDKKNGLHKSCGWGFVVNSDNVIRFSIDAERHFLGRSFVASFSFLSCLGKDNV